MSKYGVFCGPCFPAFRLNMERNSESLCIYQKRENTGQKKLSIWTLFRQWMRQLFYYKKRHKFIINCATVFIKKCDSFITKYNSFIAKCNIYWKICEYKEKVKDVLLEIKLKSFEIFYSLKQTDNTATFNKTLKNQNGNFEKISLNFHLKGKDITDNLWIKMAVVSNDLILS